MRDVNELVDVVFSGLSVLVIEDVTDEGEAIRVSARTRDDPVPCPVRGQPTGRVHGFHGRVVADVPVDGRRVVASVRARRLVCPVLGCPRQTFREQVPGVVECYQRRTNCLADQLGSVVKELAGRAGARLSRVISRSTELRMLMRRAAPPLRVPRVLGIDDIALKRRHRYATAIIDAETGERIDVLPERTAQTLAAWLREAAYVCRDGSGSYGEAIRQALPEAVQVSDLAAHRRQPGPATKWSRSSTSRGDLVLPLRAGERLAGGTPPWTSTGPEGSWRGRPWGGLDGAVALRHDRCRDARRPRRPAPPDRPGPHGHLRRHPGAFRRSPQHTDPAGEDWGRSPASARYVAGAMCRFGVKRSSAGCRSEPGQRRETVWPAAVGTF